MGVVSILGINALRYYRGKLWKILPIINKKVTDAVVEIKTKNKLEIDKLDDVIRNTYDIDTNRIYIGGSSAGAITALHVAYLDDVCEISGYLNQTVINQLGGLEGASGNPGQVNYTAAKAGVSGFSRSLAAEMGGRGITVNVVAPGFIDTEMTAGLPDFVKEEMLKRIPMKRLGQASDVAEVVAFLASDAAAYVTGETIHVNGGMYMD